MLPYVAPRLLKSFKALLALAVVAFFVLSYDAAFGPDLAGPRFPPQHVADYVCPCEKDVSSSLFSAFSAADANLTEARILLLVESAYSRHARIIMQVLNATKYHYKVETFAKNLPLLTTASRGRFSAIVIENYYKYVNLPRWNRQLLDKYCRDYMATLIAFVGSRPGLAFPKARVKGSNLTLWQNQKARELSFNSSSLVPFIGKPGAVLSEPDKDSPDWVLFEQHQSFESVVDAKDEFGRRRAVVIRDPGIADGVERILFGHNTSEWLMRIALIDALRFGTKGRFGFPLERFVQIDIDDVFVGSRGTRMIAEDVEALIKSQEELRGYIENFTYSLGFSGSFFGHGDDAEDAGDQRLIDRASHFVWFPHMWRHNHAQDYNYTYLEYVMVLNKQFAESKGLPVPSPYAISPQHAGVYPVHSSLYSAWKKVWNVSVTATEEYPHLRPSSDRRGFIHQGIMVLPRQTCGLYTHTQFFHRYPEGMSRLLSSIYGGDLFFTILLNPISIFMTHQQNYAHDRLALYSFRNVARFLRCWTNIRLRWENPLALAHRYFSLFPAEKDPIWNNPCLDERHRAILPQTFNCSNLTLPNLLIVGPQKTGTTALSSFLSLHPNVSTNDVLADSFEEVQFFSGPAYSMGVEWYSSLFSPAHVVYDKTANYFDVQGVAKRAAALLPTTHVLVILLDPSARAYSWFQHLRAKNDSMVSRLGTMEEILDGKTAEALRVKQRCITGGRYAHHLERWLELFPPEQLILVDGTRLRKEPAEVVAEVAERLDLSPFDFHSKITFVSKKKFFCPVKNGRALCLGASKGRSYPPMSDSLSSRLCSLFRADNVALQKLLEKHHFPIPSWLPRALLAC